MPVFNIFTTAKVSYLCLFSRWNIPWPLHSLAARGFSSPLSSLFPLSQFSTSIWMTSWHATPEVLQGVEAGVTKILVKKLSVFRCWTSTLPHSGFRCARNIPFQLNLQQLVPHSGQSSASEEWRDSMSRLLNFVLPRTSSRSFNLSDIFSTAFFLHEVSIPTPHLSFFCCALHKTSLRIFCLVDASSKWRFLLSPLRLCFSEICHL